MTNKERFSKIMNYEKVDRFPYFEEGIRDEVLKSWGIKRPELLKMFPVDYREDIIPELDPLPSYKNYPSTFEELPVFKKRLDPNDPKRLPENWIKKIAEWKQEDNLLVLRVHRGFFLSIGIYTSKRFTEVMFLSLENPDFINQYMRIQGEFAAAMAENILQKVKVDAVYFSEPIGSNEGSLISPQMYEELVLENYLPLLEVIKQYDIKTKIFLTYANARALIPSILKYDINCLWACEVNTKAMDYNELRNEFGKDLRLIGGIDLDALRNGKEAIRKEILEKVPTLIKSGGYVPIADGRVREEVSFENYVYYRTLLNEIINQV